MRYDEMNDIIADCEERIKNAREERLKTLVPFDRKDTVTIKMRRFVKGRWGSRDLKKDEELTGKLWWSHLTPVGKNANIRITVNSLLTNTNTKATGSESFDLLTDKFIWI